MLTSSFTRITCTCNMYVLYTRHSAIRATKPTNMHALRESEREGITVAEGRATSPMILTLTRQTLFRQTVSLRTTHLFECERIKSNAAL